MKEVIAISVKWQPSWISQNAQECGDHSHRIINNDPIDGQNPLKTTMYHICSRPNPFCLDYDGGHIGKLLPILSQVNSAMAL